MGQNMDSTPTQELKLSTFKAPVRIVLDFHKQKTCRLMVGGAFTNVWVIAVRRRLV